MKAPKKLQIDALRSDLASVDQMIERARGFRDAIGEAQFAERRTKIEQELVALELTREHTGSVALFFGGGPVLGSRGIEADFAGEALLAYQELVQKKLAIQEQGELGARGPVAHRTASQLMVTEVARGSFGFFLEEAAAGDALTDTELKTVIDQTSSLIADVASPNVELFETAMGNLDGRSLSALKKLFDVLDTSHATIRVVDGEDEFSLQRADVSRARYRVDSTEINEEEIRDVAGRLYFLPIHKTFELVRDDTGQTIYGRVEPSVIRQLTAQHEIGTRGRTILKVRRVQQRGREEKIFYRLAGIIEI